MIHMKPPHYLRFVFGGSPALAKALKISYSAVCQWNAKGIIPVKRHMQILKVAKSKGLDVKLSDLIEGRYVE